MHINYGHLAHIVCAKCPFSVSKGYYLKIFFKISFVTRRVAVLAAVFAALPRMEPPEELFLVVLVFFLVEEVLRLEVLPVIFLPTEVPT